MKTLVLLRHGDAAFGGSADVDRPLTARGRDEAGTAAAQLARTVQPDLILSSSARRARQTAEIICTQLGVGDDSIRFIEALYLAGVDTIRQVVESTADPIDQLLLVGHNPGLSNTASSYSGERISLGTADAAIIRFPVEHWSMAAPGLGTLLA